MTSSLCCLLRKRQTYTAFDQIAQPNALHRRLCFCLPEQVIG